MQQLLFLLHLVWLLLVILNNEPDRKVIAIIGDGAMTGGMAYEAMNNSGIIKIRFNCCAK